LLGSLEANLRPDWHHVYEKEEKVATDLQVSEFPLKEAKIAAIQEDNTLTASC